MLPPPPVRSHVTPVVPTSSHPVPRCFHLVPCCRTFLPRSVPRRVPPRSPRDTTSVTSCLRSRVWSVVPPRWRRAGWCRLPRRWRRRLLGAAASAAGVRYVAHASPCVGGCRPPGSVSVYVLSRRRLASYRPCVALGSAPARCPSTVVWWPRCRLRRRRSRVGALGRCRCLGSVASVRCRYRFGRLSRAAVAAAPLGPRRRRPAVGVAAVLAPRALCAPSRGSRCRRCRVVCRAVRSSPFASRVSVRVVRRWAVAVYVLVSVTGCRLTVPVAAGPLPARLSSPVLALVATPVVSLPSCFPSHRVGRTSFAAGAVVPAALARRSRPSPRRRVR